MLSFHVADGRFQVRAAAAILHEGWLLLHRARPDRHWALPGGRVDIAERAAAAVERELLEELAEPVSCGPLLFVVENFFSHAGKANHELGLYFSAALREDSPLLSKDRTHAGVESHTELEFRWFRQLELPSIDLRPAFLRDSLSQPSPRFQHVVQRG